MSLSVLPIRKNRLLAMGSHGVILFLPRKWRLREQQLFLFLALQQIVRLWESLMLCLHQFQTCVYSGTVAGAREAFFNNIPAISISYDWVGGVSNIDDYTLAAQACLPIINAVLAEIKSKTYPQRCFLNIDLPTNIRCHKGYRLTSQGKSIYRMGWKQVTSGERGKMTSAMEMDMDSTQDDNSSAMSQDQLLFRRVALEHSIDESDKDIRSLQEGYISVTPLGAISPAEADCQAYFKNWLPSVSERSFSAL
ncbi:uncharacterized protein LOC130816020 isoform X3 [Amaranthus tricolor]|uniref:uncharacterized protein LOC130816020 isoform X3 n=1 Tax=Amaranthus tricolor TaxID=29722 RepID=UPI0025851A56|nr:uncharacterized protein LOC130816020 isoform X3 [Amaranthus tricolor]